MAGLAGWGSRQSGECLAVPLQALSRLKTDKKQKQGEFSMGNYCSLHVHSSDGSFLDGLSRVEEIAARAKELEQPAVALTDHSECTGHFAFQEACKKQGIHPVFGMEGYFSFDLNKSRENKTRGSDNSHIILLAKDQEGLKNLWAWSSKAYEPANFYGKPQADLKMMKEYSAGLWASDSCFRGDQRFLTANGTKTFLETVGTTQKVLGRKAEWVDAEIRNFGKQEIYRLVVSRYGVEKEIFTTVNHRWFIGNYRTSGGNLSYKGRREATTEELCPGDRLQSVFAKNYTSRVSLSPTGIQAGIVFGDGTTVTSKMGRREAKVALYGEKNQFLLKWFPLHSTTLSHQQGHSTDQLEVRGLPGWFKDAPCLADSSMGYLYGWLAGYFAADGCVTPIGSALINSTKLEHIQLVQDVCHVLGIQTGRITEQVRMVKPPMGGERESTIYGVTLNVRQLHEDFFLIEEHRRRIIEALSRKEKPRSDWKVVSVEPTGSIEEVFCAVVPRGNAFVLEDNILTGNCLMTEFSRNVIKGDEPAAREITGKLLGVFGDNFFMELHTWQFVDPESDEEAKRLTNEMRMVNQAKVRIATELGVPLVVVNDAHYAKPEQWENHALIWEFNTRNTDQLGRGQKAAWMMSEEENVFWMSRHGVNRSVTEEAMRNSYDIAMSCTAEIKPNLEMPRLFPSEREDYAALEKAVNKAFSERDWDNPDEYRARIDKELKVISDSGFSGYFNIVADYVKAAKTGVWRSYVSPGAQREPLLVGPSRGCLAGSVPVWTGRGVVPLEQVVIGDEVLSHTGRWRRVLDTMMYPCNEELVHVRSFYDDAVGVTMTPDHRVLVEKGRLVGNPKQKGRVWEEATGDVRWVRADEIEVGDLVMTPVPKSLPAWVMSLPEKEMQAVLEGLWWGDGHDGKITTYSTSSKVLRDQVRGLLLGLGLPAGVRQEDRWDGRDEFLGDHRSWTITTTSHFSPIRNQHGASFPDKMMTRVRHIERRPAKPVYDLTVDEDHSYTTSSFVVHNSAGGSLVAYLMGITSVDSVKHGLIFERFINPGRKDFPDIDVDVPQSRRPEIKDYLGARYGHDHVCHIGTKSKSAPKATLADLCRAMKIGFADRMAMSALIDEVSEIADDEEAGWDEVLTEMGGELVPWVRKYPKLFEKMGEMVGLTRQSGTHASGILVSNKPLLGNLPTRVKNGLTVSQFDMNECAAQGAIKLDLLGLRHLDTLMVARQLIHEQHSVWVDYENFTNELDDPEIWKDIEKGDTVGIFQIETASGSRTAKEFCPKSLTDVADLISVNRPGVIRAGMLEHYLWRRHGLEAVSYDHPLMSDIVGSTYGVLVYQEQLMMACQVLAGFSLAEADDMRKIIGKKQIDKLPQMKEKFVAGCLANERFTKAAGKNPMNPINKIWGSFEAAGSYAFNKSHAIGYGMISSWEIWTKHYYPKEFIVALMQTDSGNINKYVREARKRNIKILPPDINKSERKFTIDGDVIRYGLDTIDGVGGSTCRDIEKGRPYKDFADYLARSGGGSDLGAVTKLIKIGSLESMGPRAELLRALERQRVLDRVAPTKLERLTEEEKDEIWAEKVAKYPDQYKVDIPDFSDEKVIYEIEKELVGNYVTVDPMAKYIKPLEAVCIQHPDDMKKFSINDLFHVGGMITKIKNHKTKGGKDMAFLGISWNEEEFDVVVFPDAWKSAKNLIKVGVPVACQVIKLEKGCCLNTLERLDLLPL